LIQELKNKERIMYSRRSQAQKESHLIESRWRGRSYQEKNSCL